MPRTLAVKLKLNKAPAAEPHVKSEKENTQITKSKLEQLSDQLQVPQNMEKVMVPRTISPAAEQPPPNSRRAATGLVHTTLRSTEVIETEAKTIGKESSHKEIYKFVNTNSNLNVVFMDVTKTVKNFEIINENESSSKTLLSSKPHCPIDRTPWQ